MVQQASTASPGDERESSSLRRRLTLPLLAGMVVALAVAGFALYLTMSRALVASYDETLLSKARSLGVLLEFTGEVLEFDYTPGMMPAYEGGEAREYFELWSDGEEEGFRSTTLGETDLPRRSGTVERPDSWDLALPDGRSGRALGVHLLVQPSEEAPAGVELPGVTIVVASSRERLDALLRTLLVGLLVCAGAAVLSTVWTVRVVVERGLAPVGRLAEEVAGVDAASLSSRVGTGGVPAELQPLVGKVNELLGRLETAFARQRRMTAAMAHELRTPIAELRTTADVARRWPDDEPMARDVVDTAADVSLRMSDAVEAVMRYCRVEVGQAEPELEPIELRSLLNDLWGPFERQASERELVFENRVPEHEVTLSDRGLLTIVLGNVLSNAASFASGGTVHASVSAANGSLTLDVANRTDELTPRDLELVGEPFWRKDAARSNGRHSGLGLTLVQSVSSVLGHRTAFSLEGDRFIVSIVLPRGEADARAAEQDTNGSSRASSDGRSPVG